MRGVMLSLKLITFPKKYLLIKYLYANILYLNNHPVIDFGEDRENSLMFLENNREWKSILRSPDTIEDSVLTLTFGKLVLLKNYVFPTGNKNIKITYLSGYSAETLPDDLKRVCYEKSSLKFLNSSFGPMSRLGIQFYDISNQRTRFKEEDFEKVLKRYRRRVV